MRIPGGRRPKREGANIAVSLTSALHRARFAKDFSVTIDHYLRLIKGINDQLQAIAEMAAAQGLADAGADVSNLALVALIEQHERLTRLSGRITSQIASLAASRVSRLSADQAPKEPGTSVAEVRRERRANDIALGPATTRFVHGLSHVAAADAEQPTRRSLAAGARRYAQQGKR
jgi:hypothetical protein